MTLAHELGHGVHQVLAGPQGAILSNTPLTLAETASVFGEMLTFRSMLSKTTDRTQRFAMLSPRSRTCSIRWCGKSRSTASSGASTRRASRGS